MAKHSAQHLAHDATQAASHALHEAFYQDPKFWVAIGFVIFIALAAKYIWPAIARFLDNRANLIREQLEQATRLHAEAEALLASYKQQQAQMVQDAQEIVAQATRDTQIIRDNAAKELTQTLARRTAQAEESIARAETDAKAQLRTRIIDLATQNARSVVAEQLQGQKDDPSIARALKAIEAQIH